MSRTTRRVLVGLKVGIGILLLAWLLQSVEVDRIVAVLRASRSRLLFAGLGVLIASGLTQAMRLQVLLRRYGATPIESLEITLGGFLFNQFLPGGMGGESYRALRIKRLTDQWTSALGLITLERIIGFGVLTVTGVSYALTDWRRFAVLVSDATDRATSGSLALWIGLGVSVSVLVAVGALARNRRFRRRLAQLIADLRATYRSLTAAQYGAVFAWSIVYHLTQAAGLLLLLRAFDERLGWLPAFVVLTLTLLVSFLPFSLGSLGIKEGAIVFGMALYQVGTDSALTVALFNRLALLVLGLLGALSVMLGSGRPVLVTPPADPEVKPPPPPCNSLPPEF